jgi:Flp pilus assembly protein TadG
MTGMMRWARQRRGRLESGRRGQALVEFVLIAPILLLIIFGLVDFARAWSAHHVIADAAREGARMLVVFDVTIGTAEAEATINNRLATARLDPANANIEFLRNGASHTGSTTERGDDITVTVDYLYDFWILGPFMNWATGDRQVNLVSTITMRSE